MDISHNTPTEREGIESTIKRIHHFCSHPILPTAYSDALSYMEQLCQFSTKLNEVIDRLNEFTGSYESYVAEQLKPYQDQLNNLEEKLNTTLDDVNSQLDAALDEVNTKLDTSIDKITTDITNFETTINQAIRDNQAYVNRVVQESKDYSDKVAADSKTYVDGQIAGLESKLDVQFQALKDDIQRYVTLAISGQLSEIFSYVDEVNENTKQWVQLELDKFLADLPQGSIIVINPITGVLDTLQNTLNDLANATKWNALNCDEWDALMLTVDQFDGKMLTAYQIDWYSRSILVPNEWAYMHSPFTGAWVTIASVVDELANYHKAGTDGALTAAEYDSAQLTATAYDDLNLTAYDYDWHGKKYITPAA